MSYASYLEETSKQLFNKMELAVYENPIAEEGFESLLKSLEYKNYSPVTRIEDMLGISGVYQTYKFPENIDPLTFESYLKPARIYEMAERGYLKSHEKEAIKVIMPHKKETLNLTENAFECLAELNPELKTIPNSKTIHNYIAIISGVCSGFPLKDIGEFCSYIKNNDKDKCDQLNYMRCEYSTKIKELITLKGNPNNSKNIPELNKRLEKGGVFLNWCPSQESFEKIYNALNKNLDKQQMLIINSKKKGRL